MTAARPAGFERQGWWQRRVVRPVLDQLTNGMSPGKLAWTVSAGMVLGIFPIMGSTTLICLLAGWLLKLNQPVLHIFKSLVYPLHLGLILVFIRLGQKLHGVPLIAFSIPQLLTRFKEDPVKFAGDFGLAAWHGVTAWMLVAPVLAVGIRFAVAPLLRGMISKLERRKELQP